MNPEGLGGNWTRGSGPAYEKLRDEVIAALSELADDNGARPLVHAAKWEDAPAYYELPTDRVGDIVLEAAPGYQWQEEVTKDSEMFVRVLPSGYKQGIDPKKNNGMWTPFVIMGPGVKKGIRAQRADIPC